MGSLKNEKESKSEQPNTAKKLVFAPEKLKARRKALKLSVPAIAKVTRLSNPCIYAMESGNGNPRIDNLLLVAHALGSNPASFLVPEGSMENKGAEAEGGE